MTAIFSNTTVAKPRQPPPAESNKVPIKTFLDFSIFGSSTLCRRRTKATVFPSSTRCVPGTCIGRLYVAVFTAEISWLGTLLTPPG